MADTFVSARSPSWSGGAGRRLVVDGSPRRQAFIRFDVPALSGNLISATLRLHVADLAGAGSPAGGTVAGSSDVTWAEATTSWSNRPPIDRRSVGPIGRARRNHWVERRVTALVRPGTLVTLAITSANADDVAYDARGAGLGPRLVLDVAQPPADSVVVAAAGDLVCGPDGVVTETECHHQAVSDLLVDDPAVGAFLALGDLQYNFGELADFQSEYEPSYGRVKDITRPVPGNHDYGTPVAAGYFEYFGAPAGDPAEGWYSFDVGGAWHVVALNSNCSEVSCGTGSAQLEWLRGDLAATTRPCVLAYWHHAPSSSGDTPAVNPHVTPFLRVLQQHGAEVVLAGHAHNYERFARQRADGTAAANGIRQFVVGTGGRSVGPDFGFDAVQPNSQVRIAHVFGLLRLTLSASSYRWSFVDEGGHVLDTGSDACH